MNDCLNPLRVCIDYGLLPDSAVRPISQMLPVAEVFVGASLLSGHFRLWSALAATGLFLLFASAVVINLLRGRRDIACGCFGVQQERRLTWGIVMRSLALAGVAIALGMGQPNSFAWPWLFFSGSERVGQLSIEETVATILVASAVLILWWLWGTLLTLWRLPDPGRGCEGCS